MKDRFFDEQREVEFYELWLQAPPEDRKRLEALCRPLPAGEMHMQQVSRRVNKPANDDPDVLQELH